MDLRRHNSASWTLNGKTSLKKGTTLAIPETIDDASSMFSSVLAAGDVIQGNVHTDFPVPSNVLRIYLSCNDKDTDMEMNAILEKIIPSLREKARAKGVEVQLVALRWGIPRCIAVERLSLESCQERLDGCKQLSCGVYFMCILTDKYGHRPVPTAIPVEEFIALSERIQMRRAVALLSEWYIRDDNSQPPMYVLKPLSELFPNFFSKNPKLQKKEEERWSEEVDVLLFAMRNATLGFDIEDKNKYFNSVVHAELERAILDNYEERKSLAFFRHFNAKPEDLPVIHSDRILDGSFDEDAHKLLENLKTTVSNKMDADDIYSYDLDTKSKDQAKYLQKFEADCDEILGYSLNAAALSLVKFQEDPLILDILYHTRMCQEKTRHFTGRGEIMRKFNSYITRRRKTVSPLVVYGEPGVGRASCMARAAMSASAAQASVTVVRFVNITADSANIRQLLFSICTQIVRAYRLELRETLGNIEKEIHAIHDEIARGDEEANEEVILHLKQLKWQYDFERVVHEDYESLIMEFPYRLRLASAKKPLYIFIDSVDQLQNVYKPYDFDWLPTELPEHCRLSISTAMADPNACLMSLREKFGGDDQSFMEIPTLTPDDTHKILELWFNDCGRTLTEEQTIALHTAADGNMSVLFLQICYLQARQWQSHTEDSTFKATAAMSLEELLGQFATSMEKRHGKALVSHALGYICAARFGISETELEDVLSLDDEVLDEVYMRFLPPVRRFPQMYWARLRRELDVLLVERGSGLMLYWNHAVVKKFFSSRYLKGSRFKETHDMLAQYFGGRWHNLKKPYVLSSVLMKQHSIKKADGEANRFVPSQPFKFVSQGKTLVNRRKLEELGYHLVRAGDGKNFVYQCLSNFDWLSLKIKISSIHDLLDEIREAMADPHCELDPEVSGIIYSIISLSAAVVSQDNSRFASQLLGRILPSVQLPACLQNLVIQARLLAFEDNIGLVPMRTCLLSPGCRLLKMFQPFSYDIPWLNFTNRGNRLAAFLRTSSDPVFGEDILRLYDVDTGFELQNFQLITSAVEQAEEHATEDTEVPVSRVIGTYWTSAGMLVTSHSDGTFCVWDVEDKERIFECNIGQRVTEFATSRDGTLIIYPNTIVATVFNAETGQNQGSLQGHTQAVTVVDLSLDSNVAITGSKDMTARLHTVEDCKPLGCLGGHAAPLTCVKLSPDSSLAITSDGLTTFVHQVKTLASLQAFPHFGITRAVFSPAGGRFAISAVNEHTNYSIRVYDIADLSCPEMDLWGHADKVTSISFAPDNSLISGSRDGTIRQWTLSSNPYTESGLLDQARQEQLAISLAGATKAVEDSAGIRLNGPIDCFAATASLAVLGSGHGSRCVVVSLAKGKIVSSFELASDQLLYNGVAISPDSEQVVATFRSGTTVVFGAADGVERRRLPDMPPRLVGPTISAAAGITCAGLRYVARYDLATGRQVKKFSVRVPVDEPIQRVVAAAESANLFIGFATQMVVCNLDGLVLKMMNYAKNDPISLAEPLRNGDFVMSSSHQSQKIIMWNTKPERPAGEGEYDLDGPRPTACCASPDGRYAAGGFQQGLMKIWDIENTEEMFSEFVHEDSLICMRMHRNSETDTLWLATGSEDWTLRTWKLVDENWIPYHTYHSDAPIVKITFSDISILYGCANGAVGVVVIAPQAITDIVLPSMVPLGGGGGPNSKSGSRRNSKSKLSKNASSNSMDGRLSRKESCAIM